MASASSWPSARPVTVVDVYAAAFVHRDDCPRALALIPLAVIGGPDPGPDGRLMVHHPPELCRYCETAVTITDRTTRAKNARDGGSATGRRTPGRVYCTPEHKQAARDPAWQSVQDRAAAGLPPRTTRTDVCPTPAKRSYATREDCLAAFADLMARDPYLRAYGCACGCFHAGHSAYDEAPQVRAPLSAPIGQTARITPLRMPKKKPTHPVKDKPMPAQPAGLAALQRVPTDAEVRTAIDAQVAADPSLEVQALARIVCGPAPANVVIHTNVAPARAAIADAERHLALIAAGTPLFDQLAPVHGFTPVWPPHFEDHNGFMARHGQTVWLAETMSSLEALRVSQERRARRDARGRFVSSL